MQIKWIGQAGILIDTGKFKIMVDPYLSDSVTKINPKNRRRMKVDENLCERVVCRGENAERIRRKGKDCCRARCNGDEMGPVRKELS